MSFNDVVLIISVEIKLIIFDFVLLFPKRKSCDRESLSNGKSNKEVQLAGDKFTLSSRSIFSLKNLQVGLQVMQHLDQFLKH